MFLLAGNYPALPYKYIPALRWIRRSDGALVKSVNVMDVFNNNSNKLESLTLRSDGNFNFSFVRRPVYDDAAGFLYAGVIDTAGNVLSLHFTGDHTGFDFPAFTPMTQEVVLPSGNRFLVSGIDTTLNDELAISNLFKTYLLDENGAVIKDSLLHFPGDTIYRVTDLDLAENGEVLVAGELFNWGALDQNNKEIFLMRYSAQGELLWHKTYAPFFFHHYANRVNVHQVEEDLDGGILITGHIYRALDTILTSPNGERYGFILKVGPDGCYFNNCEGGFILTDVNEAPIIDLAAPLRVFPNPAADELNLQFFRPVHGAIRIYDAMGRLHWSGASSGAPDQQIGLGNWPPGLYLLQLEEEGRRYTVKFVKM
ncbi:MAG: T9SS type A sorting domain-containing protein [Saprospiraceae bacterium]